MDNLVKRFSVIFLLLLVIILIVFSKKKKLEYELVPLDYGNFNLENKNNSLGMYNVFNDSLMLSITDFGTSDLGITKSIISYNFETKDVFIKDLDNNIRIIDFIIKDNYIYYITLENFENSIQWKMIYSDLTMNNSNELISGVIINPLDHPVFFIDENNLIYFISYDYSMNKNKIFKLENNNLNMIYENSIKMYDLMKVIVKNNNIYFISLNETENILYRFDMINEKLDSIYEAIDEELIFDFEVSDNNIFINLIFNNESKFLILDSENRKIKEQKFSVAIPSMELGDDNNVFLRFDDYGIKSLLSNGDFVNLIKLKKDSFYYKFRVYKNKYFVVQNYDGKLYLYMKK